MKSTYFYTVRVHSAAVVTHFLVLCRNSARRSSWKKTSKSSLGEFVRVSHFLFNPAVPTPAVVLGGKAFGRDGLMVTDCGVCVRKLGSEGPSNRGSVSKLGRRRQKCSIFVRLCAALLPSLKQDRQPSTANQSEKKVVKWCTPVAHILTHHEAEGLVRLAAPRF